MASTNTNDVNILQWNCRSVIPKIDRLKALITSFDVDIFCLNETWLVESKFFRIPQFKIIRKDRNISYGGVLIGIRDNIEFKYLDLSLHSQIEYVAISIKNNGFVFSIICFYIPPNTCFSLTQIKNILNQIPSPFYILGDFNAHNIASFPFFVY
jgi:exonuclease III